MIFWWKKTLSNILFLLLKFAFSRLQAAPLKHFSASTLMNACIGALAPEASRGRWISLSQVTATLTAFAAPYFGGIMYENSPYTPFYLVIVFTPLLAVIGFTKPFRQT